MATSPLGTSDRSASDHHSHKPCGVTCPSGWIIAQLAYGLFCLRSLLGWCLGYLAGLVPSRERKVALLQLRRFLPNTDPLRLTPKVFANVGRVALESLSLRPLVQRHSRRIACEGWDDVIRWTHDQRPIIALTAHTGNWDLLAAYVIARGIPLTTVGREARKRYAQVILEWIRNGYGIETVWRSDKAALKRLMQCLKERRVIAALIDQDTRVESISVPFFGHPAKTPVSLIRLGKKFNARFVTAFLFRTGWFRYSVFVAEIPDLGTEEAILQEYNSRLEGFIRQYPDQWVWFHKRWRSAPDGSSPSTHEYIARLEREVTEHPASRLTGRNG